MIKTREDVITDMCFTRRHDFELNKDYHEFSGMDNKERQCLWDEMAQLFDNNIAPYMEFKNIEA